MKRLPPKAALAILAGGAATALAGLFAPGAAHEAKSHLHDGLSCAVVARDMGEMVEISGSVTAKRGVAGAYALRIRQHSAAGQAMIDQSGDFTAAPGRTVTLGQAVLGGPASRYHAELDLNVDGQRLRCRGADDRTDL